MNRTCNRVTIRIALACVLVCGLSGLATAQGVDMAEVMPEGTILYIGWAGSEQVAKAGENTALGKTLADPQVKRFVETITGGVDRFLAMGAAESGEAWTYETLKRMLATLLERPTGIGLFDLGFSEAGPAVNLALVCNLGNDGKAFLGDLETLITRKQLPPPVAVTLAGHAVSQLALPVPGGLYFGVVKEHFILAVGSGTVERVIALLDGSAKSLADSEELEVARAKIGGNSRTRAVTIFVNTARVLEIVDGLLPMITEGDMEKAAWISKVISILGLDGLQSACRELHQRNGGFVNSAFLRLEGERRGIFSAIADSELTDADLALVPKEPPWMLAFNFNPASAYAGLRSAVKSIDVEADAELAEGIAEAEAKLGLRLKDDFLDVMGDTFVLYDDPETGGFLFTGLTVVMDSSDPQHFVKSLRQLAKVLDGIDKDTRVSVSCFDYLDHRIEFLNIAGIPMFVAPAWTIHGDRIIAGLFPQMVKGALDRAVKRGASDAILANADFVRGRKVLGRSSVCVSYTDTKRGAEELYGLALPISQILVAMAQGEGVEVDISSFPTRQALTQHLFAHVGSVQVDDSGMLFSSYGPLPVAVPSLGNAGGLTAPLVVSILLPSLSRARELSKRLVSASNLRGIGMACHIYANDNNDKFPPDLQTLMRAGDLDEKALHAPSDDTGKRSYVYIAGQNGSSDARNILAHEREDLNNGEGVNVLFVDGHVEFMKPEQFEREMQSTRERMAARSSAGP